MAAAVFALSRRMSRKFSRQFTEFVLPDRRKEADHAEHELQVVRKKNEQGIDDLARNSRFSRKEIQIMYRGFKQECPSGYVSEETFKHIYAQFFPQGDSDAYAFYVFNTFDTDKNGCISFEEFVMGLSILARGSVNEKLQWAFELYDINGDGMITHEEMLQIVKAIYEMLGKFVSPPIDDCSPKDHVDRIFTKMDLNHDGVITLDEFMETCRSDDTIYKSLTVFDTAL